VRLPDPQPISAEALASIPREPPPAPPSEPPAPKPVRRAGPVPPPPAKTEPEPEPEAEPVPPPEPRIQALVSPGERRRLRRSIETRRREIESLLERLKNSAQPEQREGAERVASFLALSAQAAERGDLRQADALSARALSLARDLTDGR
jgi:hypothetical protein